MKIGDFGMSRQIVMARNAAGEVGLERALSSNVIGTAAYCAPELLLADSPVKRNKASAATILKSDVSDLYTAPAAACIPDAALVTRRVCQKLKLHVDTATALTAATDGSICLQRAARYNSFLF